MSTAQWGLIEAVLREDTQAEVLAEAERLLYEALTRASDRGIEATIADAMLAVQGLESRRDLDGVVERVLQSASIRLGVEQAAEVQPAIMRAVQHAYEHGRISVPLPEPGAGSVNWTVTDKRALDWLQRDTLYWAGRFNQAAIVSDGAGGTISVGDLIAREARAALESGESSTAAGKRLRAVLGPIRGNVVDSYWRGLAANAITRANTFGTCAAFVEADVVSYEIVSVLDERTSTVCRELDGLTFQTRQLVQQRDAMMAAASPDDVKTIQPWPKTPAVRDLKAEGGATALAAAGIRSPPFHFHCRTTIVVSEYGYVTTTEAPVPPMPPAQDDPDRRDTFTAAFDSRDPSLYDRGWREAHPEGMRLGQVLERGYAEGTEYREPFMRGLRMSAWPTVPVPRDRRRYWWRPEPSTRGGVWVPARDEAPPGGAIVSDAFLAWLS